MRLHYIAFYLIIFLTISSTTSAGVLNTNKIDNNYWYYEEDIKSGLISTGVYHKTMYDSVKNDYCLYLLSRDNMKQIGSYTPMINKINRMNTNDFFLMPRNSGGSHWTAMVVYKDNQGILHEINVNSFNNWIAPIIDSRDVHGRIRSHYISGLYQTGGDCGPYTVNHLGLIKKYLEYITNNGTNFNINDLKQFILNSQKNITAQNLGISLRKQQLSLYNRQQLDNLARLSFNSPEDYEEIIKVYAHDFFSLNLYRPNINAQANSSTNVNTNSSTNVNTNSNTNLQQYLDNPEINILIHKKNNDNLTQGEKNFIQNYNDFLKKHIYTSIVNKCFDQDKAKKDTKVYYDKIHHKLNTFNDTRKRVSGITDAFKGINNKLEQTFVQKGNTLEPSNYNFCVWGNTQYGWFQHKSIEFYDGFNRRGGNLNVGGDVDVVDLMKIGIAYSYNNHLYKYSGINSNNFSNSSSHLISVYSDINFNDINIGLIASIGSENNVITTFISNEDILSTVTSQAKFKNTIKGIQGTLSYNVYTDDYDVLPYARVLFKSSNIDGFDEVEGGDFLHSFSDTKNSLTSFILGCHGSTLIDDWKAFFGYNIEVPIKDSKSKNENIIKYVWQDSFDKSMLADDHTVYSDDFLHTLDIGIKFNYLIFECGLSGSYQFGTRHSNLSVSANTTISL